MPFALASSTRSAIRRPAVGVPLASSSRMASATRSVCVVNATIQGPSASPLALLSTEALGVDIEPLCPLLQFLRPLLVHTRPCKIARLSRRVGFDPRAQHVGPQLRRFLACDGGLGDGLQQVVIHLPHLSGVTEDAVPIGGEGRPAVLRRQKVVALALHQAVHQVLRPGLSTGLGASGEPGTFRDHGLQESVPSRRRRGIGERELGEPAGEVDRLAVDLRLRGKPEPVEVAGVERSLEYDVGEEPVAELIADRCVVRRGRLGTVGRAVSCPSGGCFVAGLCASSARFCALDGVPV